MNELLKSVSALVDETRVKVPLVHCITNYVTVNDCANALLAVGGSPIMADDIHETADITSICNALVINIGTLNERTVASVVASGKKANQQGIPVVFDPVGAGASAYRNETTLHLLKQLKMAIIRGNLSEISFVAGLAASTRGVDSSVEDSKNNPEQTALMAATCYGCTVAITGATDVITDGVRLAKIHNGNADMSKITGTGCMATAITGAYSGVSSDPFTAAITAITVMGICGDIAKERAQGRGAETLRIGIMDTLSNINGTTLLQRHKIDG